MGGPRLNIPFPASHAEAMAKFLQELVRIPSLSSHEDAVAIGLAVRGVCRIARRTDRQAHGHLAKVHVDEELPAAAARQPHMPVHHRPAAPSQGAQVRFPVDRRRPALVDERGFHVRAGWQEALGGGIAQEHPAVGVGDERGLRQRVQDSPDQFL